MYENVRKDKQVGTIISQYRDTGETPPLRVLCSLNEMWVHVIIPCWSWGSVQHYDAVECVID